MKITIQAPTKIDNQILEAWIAPNAPAYRDALHRVIDTGFLCVRLTSDDTIDDFRFESTSEDRWKLVSLLPGHRHLADKLISAHMQYSKRPFFHVIDHETLGKLYFEPIKRFPDQPGAPAYRAFAASLSAPESRMAVPGDQELWGIVFAGKMNLHAASLNSPLVLPDGDQISHAAQEARLVVEHIRQEREQYEKLVKWHFDRDIAYDALRHATTRPSADSFADDSAEFYRWYTHGGKPHPEPLTLEVLNSVLESIPNSGGRHAAMTAEDWRLAKEIRLRHLNEPITALQTLVATHASDESFWDASRKAADWTRSFASPEPTEIYDAAYGLVFRARMMSQIHGSELPAWYHDAVKIGSMVAKYCPPGHADEAGKTLTNAVNLLTNCQAHIREALACNDAFSAQAELREASRIEKTLPILTGIIALSSEVEPESQHADFGTP